MVPKPITAVTPVLRYKVFIAILAHTQIVYIKCFQFDLPQGDEQ